MSGIWTAHWQQILSSGGGVTLSIGILMIFWSLLWDRLFGRVRTRRRCPKCGYDMRGTPGLRCSECGFNATAERQLHTARRRWRWAIIATSLVVVGTAALITPTVRQDGWIGLVPTDVLILTLPELPDTGSTMVAELDRRVGNASLSDRQWRALGRRLWERERVRGFGSEGPFRLVRRLRKGWLKAMPTGMMIDLMSERAEPGFGPLCDELRTRRTTLTDDQIQTLYQNLLDGDGPPRPQITITTRAKWPIGEHVWCRCNVKQDTDYLDRFFAGRIRLWSPFWRSDPLQPMPSIDRSRSDFNGRLVDLGIPVFLHDNLADPEPWGQVLDWSLQLHGYYTLAGHAFRPVWELIVKIPFEHVPTLDDAMTPVPAEGIEDRLGDLKRYEYYGIPIGLGFRPKATLFDLPPMDGLTIPFAIDILYHDACIDTVNCWRTAAGRMYLEEPPGSVREMVGSYGCVEVPVQFVVDPSWTPPPRGCVSGAPARIPVELDAWALQIHCAPRLALRDLESDRYAFWENEVRIPLNQLVKPSLRGSAQADCGRRQHSTPARIALDGRLGFEYHCSQTRSGRTPSTGCLISSTPEPPAQAAECDCPSFSSACFKTKSSSSLAARRWKTASSACFFLN